VAPGVWKRSVVSRNNSLLQFELKGVQGLEQALRDLGQDRLIKATMKRALMEVAQPAAADARALAAKATGQMARKIAVSTTLSRRQRRGRGRGARNGQEAVVYIGAGPRGPAVLVEFGTGPRRHKNGKSVGASPAQPFMRPAWEAHKHKILNDFADALWRQVARSADRLGRRQKKAAGIR
jgi:HK97 gp10 family phage protein